MGCAVCVDGLRDLPPTPCHRGNLLSHHHMLSILSDSCTETPVWPFHCLFNQAPGVEHFKLFLISSLVKKFQRIFESSFFLLLMLFPENEFLDVDLLGQSVCASPRLLLCSARTHPGRVIPYQEWMKISVLCTVYGTRYHPPFLDTRFISADDSQFLCVFI